MKAAHRIGFGIVLCAMPVWLAVGETPSAEAPAQDLVRRSGLARQVSELSGMANAYAKNLQPTLNLPEDALGVLNEAIARAYAVSNLEPVVRAHIQAHLSAEDQQAVLAWLDTPLGRATAAAEAAVASPKDMETMDDTVKELRKKPEAAERVRVIQRFDRATGASDKTVDLIVEIRQAVSGAMKAAGQPGAPAVPISPEDRASLKMAVVAMNEELGLFAYRSVSVDDLSKYAVFVESDLGVRYHKALFGALRAAMLDAHGRLTQAVRQLIRLRQEKDVPAGVQADGTGKALQ